MNNNLEQATLYATAMGHLSPLQLKPHLPQFSKEGKMVHQAIKWLLDQGQTPPFGLDAIKLTCTEIKGWDKSLIEPYLNETWSHVSGSEIGAVLKGSLDKFRLLEVSNILSKQMSEGTFDPIAFTDVFQHTQETSATLQPLAEEAKTWEGQDGTIRVTIGDWFPRLQEETGGLHGFWVIGGITGTGKSTLAWQLSLIAGKERPILYYDLENTRQVLYSRTVQAMDGDIGAAHEALRRVYVRTEPKEVFRDVYQLGEPCLVVLDSLQKLPSDVHYKRESMEDWLAKLDRLKQQGHIVIMVSQLNRADGGYKGTNDIEHTADFGIKLDSCDDDPLQSGVWIEKNRHGLARGWFTRLRRENNWLWRET